MKPNSQSKSAGGQAWHKAKAGNKAISWDGPVPEHIVQARRDGMEQRDREIKGKNLYKQGITDYEEGMDRQSSNPEYLMGYSYAETISNKD